MGRHLILDYEVSGKQLNDKRNIYKFLSNLVKIIRMRKLTEPIVKQGKPYLQGVSGFIMIETSHCSIHTFTMENRLIMDIYSCNDFNDADVIAHLNKHFNNLKLLNKNVITRDDGQVLAIQ